METPTVGSIGMTSRPRGGDWLDDEIRDLHLADVKALVCLLEPDEVFELELNQEKELCKKRGLEFIHFPIRDRGIPEDPVLFNRLVEHLQNLLKEGAKIVIHCRMGIGRTSILTACLLIRLGLKHENIFDAISEKRTLKVPDTLEQEQWVMHWS